MVYYYFILHYWYYHYCYQGVGKKSQNGSVHLIFHVSIGKSAFLLTLQKGIFL